MNINLVQKPVNKTVSTVVLVLSWVPNNWLLIDLIEENLIVTADAQCEVNTLKRFRMLWKRSVRPYYLISL